MASTTHLSGKGFHYVITHRYLSRAAGTIRVRVSCYAGVLEPLSGDMPLWTEFRDYSSASEAASAVQRHTSKITAHLNAPTEQTEQIQGETAMTTQTATQPTEAPALPFTTTSGTQLTAYAGTEQCGHCWETAEWSIRSDGWTDLECSAHALEWWPEEMQELADATLYNREETAMTAKTAVSLSKATDNAMRLFDGLVLFRGKAWTLYTVEGPDYMIVRRPEGTLAVMRYMTVNSLSEPVVFLVPFGKALGMGYGESAHLSDVKPLPKREAGSAAATFIGGVHIARQTPDARSIAGTDRYANYGHEVPPVSPRQADAEYLMGD